MNFFRLRITLVVAATVFLMACSTVNQQAYTAVASSPIRKIVVVTQDQAPPVGVGFGGSPGLMFGAIGAGIAAANASGAGKTMNQLITEEGMDYHRRLQERLSTGLAKAGMSTVWVTVPRTRGIDFVQNYQAVAAEHGADAVLDLVVLEASFGGTHPFLDPKPRPILRAKTKLVSGKTGEQLYAEEISSGYSNPFMSATELQSPKEFYFESIDAVREDAPRAARGMGHSVDEVANHIATQLRSGRPNQ